MREPVEWPTRDPLSHRAGTTPERTACIDADTDRSWTYREFDTVVDGLAARLESLVPADEDVRIGLFASTRVDFFVAVHASFRLGATVVPLDAKLTGTELSRRLDGVDLDAVICEAATEEVAVSTATCQVTSLDEPGNGAVEALQPTEAAESVEPARWRPENEAIIMFTSGTTGDPKGVRLTMRNLISSATASAFRLGVSPGNRWLCCLPAYHMGGLAPGIRTPLYGTTLVVQEEFDATGTADALAQTGATGVSLVPTQLRRLLADGWEPASTLETVLLGGAPAGEDLLERALDAGVPVYPSYGLTETASQVATARPEQVRSAPETVGQPLVVTDVTVVDESGDPATAGDTGELVVDGPTVTPGYLDDERTEQALGTYGLHTGDVGYRDEDGQLWVLGRADDTIVTGGENVHPSEVADALREHPGVENAAVVGLPDEEWGERVAALLVPHGDQPAADALDAHLRERLAGYKLPKTIGFVPELPRTASGTVDRDAVRAQLTE